jgi:hypothetical protein
MQEEAFTTWFPVVVQDDINQGIDVSMDVQALLMPPSRNTKSYKSMYAYGNHIRVRSVESNMNTCDSGVAATFMQACHASNNSRNIWTKNLEYIGWVEEIIGIDYGEFELIVLYCTWVRANIQGVGATMKRDDYGFTLIKFDRIIPYSADSFAFPLYVQQVFFVDDVENPEWKVVLRKETRGARVASTSERRPEPLSLILDRDEDYRGLRSNILNEDVQPRAPVLEGCTIPEAEDVHVTMQEREEEANYNEDRL